MTIAIICLIIGGVIGYFVSFNVTAVTSVYFAISILAAFDSILGGIVATINKTFDLAIFISGFFANAILSVVIIYFGTKVGLDIYLGIVFVFVLRIFQNFAIIRRFLLNKFKKSVKIEKE